LARLLSGHDGDPSVSGGGGRNSRRSALVGDTRGLESPHRQIRGYLTEVKHPTRDRVTLSTGLLGSDSLITCASKRTESE
jgi:hypothetical protein